MTFRTPQERTIQARALTDPKPAFVSVVTAGANQAPFRSVKMDPASDGHNDLHGRIKAMKIKGHEVQKMTFKIGETFADEAAVRAWLTEGGYPVDSLKAVEDGFEIENTEDTFVDGSVVQIETDNGNSITVWVGKTEGTAGAAVGDATTERSLVRDVSVVGKKEEATEEVRAGKEADVEPVTEPVEKEDTPVVEAAKEEAVTEKRETTSARQLAREGRSLTLDPPFVAAKEDEAAAVEEGAEKVEAVEKEDEPEVVQLSEADVTIKTTVEEVAAAKRAYLEDEPAKRFDDFMAHFSESMTLGGVVADANDGIPAGFGEAVQSMVVAMRNNILAGDINGVRGVAVEFGDLIVALANAFQGSESADRAAKSINLFSERLPAVTEPAAETVEEEQTEKDMGTTNVTSVTDVVTQKESDGSDTGAAAVLKAIGELAAKVEANAAETGAAIKEVTKRVEDSTAGLAERLKGLEDERQTRKSADADETNGSPVIREKGILEDITLRGHLGISNVSRVKGF